jgi:thioredoxin 1
MTNEKTKRGNMNLKNEIAKTGYTIVKFYADWCAPCKMMAPILEKVAKRDGVTLISINADKFPDLTQEYDVQSLPTLIFCKDGEIINKQVGTMNEQMIIKHLESL